MKIPNEQLQKYNVSIEHLDDEDGTYRTYLMSTDYEIIKGVESLFSASSLTEFFSNLKALNTLLKETIQYRQIAREELS